MIARAYGTLGTCREWGHPIPWSAIHEYAEAKGITERERFEHLIGAMDSEHLSAARRQMTRQGKARNG